jgi:hypothetical protein
VTIDFLGSNDIVNPIAKTSWYTPLSKPTSYTKSEPYIDKSDLSIQIPLSEQSCLTQSIFVNFNRCPLSHYFGNLANLIAFFLCSVIHKFHIVSSIILYCTHHGSQKWLYGWELQIDHAMRQLIRWTGFHTSFGSFPDCCPTTVLPTMMISHLIFPRKSQQYHQLWSSTMIKSDYNCPCKHNYFAQEGWTRWQFFAEHQPLFNLLALIWQITLSKVEMMLVSALKIWRNDFTFLVPILAV